MKTIGFLVLKGGAPCELVNVTGGNKGGVLMPGKTTVQFLKLRDARRAISRTKKVAAMLAGSLVGQWEKVQPLFVDQPFTILPITKQ